jgi:hypothetical protein
MTEGIRHFPILELMPHPAFIFLFNDLHMTRFAGPFLWHTSI